MSGLLKLRAFGFGWTILVATLLAAIEPDGRAVICPVCRFGNFPGDDTCANCGADLWNVDTPQGITTFRGKLLGLHLDELGAPEPHLIDAGASVEDAIGRMRAEGVDCLLVTDAGVLVGIFTDRDAILKVAGQPIENRTVGEVMTHDPVILRRPSAGDLQR